MDEDLLNDERMKRFIKGIKVNKGNFTATLIRFNQNLNYEKIYVFQQQIYNYFLNCCNDALSF